MKFKIIDVPIKAIDVNNSTFKITTRFCTEHLSASIHGVGLISNPYLIKKGDRYIIVSGFRRIIACKKLKYQTISAKVIKDTTSTAECAKLAIVDNAFQRELNIVETSKCYHLLKNNMNDLDLNESLGVSLGLSLSPSAFKKIEPISSLPWSIQKGLIEGYLSLPVALEIGIMKACKSNIFIELFEKLNTTFNNQREIMELITEICLRDNKTVDNLLNNIIVKKIFEKNSNRQQKTNQLKTYLKSLRYPIITSTLDAFKKKLEELQLNQRVKLNYPKNFEGSSYTLNIIFDSCKELKNYQEDLDKIINYPDLLRQF